MILHMRRDLNYLIFLQTPVFLETLDYRSRSGQSHCSYSTQHAIMEDSLLEVSEMNFAFCSQNYGEEEELDWHEGLARSFLLLFWYVVVAMDAAQGQGLVSEAAQQFQQCRKVKAASASHVFLVKVEYPIRVSIVDG